MISICIPVFNRDVSALVKELSRQCEGSGTKAEIILVDDASDESYRKMNRKLQALPGIQYKELDQNLGRSRVRNLLSARASFKYLLFMDCDVIPASGSFIKTYSTCATQGSAVCGGHIYQTDDPGEDFLLHWRAGSAREVKPAATRQTRPYGSFMSSNFLICRDAFEVTGFNEGINGYGHEDTLFGYTLKKKGIEIIHIDNPVIHLGLEKPSSFLEKSREALFNLISTLEITGKDPDFLDSVRVLRTHQALKRYRLCPIIGFMHRIFSGTMEKHLKGKNPRLWVFDLYKLSFLCSIDK